MADYGPAAPHGPDMSGRHPSLVYPNFDMNGDEERVFRELLKPDDSYDENGVYWADLPWFKRARFVLRQDLAEYKREGSNIWAMVKKDPLSPVGFYFRNMVLPGAGLGLEGYVLFSIGNLKPLFIAAFPACWGSPPTGGKACSTTWLAAIEYMEIVGIIFGQISVGIIGDWLGRRWGLIQDATIMFLGLVMLVSMWGVTLNGWIICYVLSLFIYGVGVGGEYPMTATSGMENAVGSGKVSTKDDRMHRGRKVTSAFLMQGWGQFFNQGLLILLLLIFHHGSGNPPYSKIAAQWTFRISFAIPAIGTLWLVYYRTFKMKSASKQLQLQKKKSNVTGYDTRSLKLTFSHFGGRILATAGTWYMNDVFFYGNKLFQSEFIGIVTNHSKSILPGWEYNMINVAVSLCGYYLASFLIDNKLYGRKHMMTVGFLMDFLLFVIPGFRLDYYTQPANIRKFQAMYFLSSFFNQFGPNSVSFIAAAEVYPTAVRATAHGFSAAVGKLGALTAAVMYSYISTQMKFYVVPWFGLAGVVLTVVFLPDTTGLDLKEQERRWSFIRADRGHEYHGVAVHPKHLSLWERTRGLGKQYDPELDYAQRVQEMRKEWEVVMQEKADEKAGHLDEEDFADLDLEFSHEVHEYFKKTSRSPLLAGQEKTVNGSGVSDEDTVNEKRAV